MNRCEDCRNYKANCEKPGKHLAAILGRDVGHGECRIGPPQPSDSIEGTRWPLVWADDWCGAFMSRDSDDDSGEVPIPPPDGERVENTLPALFNKLSPADVAAIAEANARFAAGERGA